MTTSCTYTFDPENHDATTLTETWNCPHEATGNNEHCLFHTSPSDYDKHGIGLDEVQDSFMTLLKEGRGTDKEFIGAEFQLLDFDYLDIESEDQHPIDLRHATIQDGITAIHSRFEEQLDLRHTTLGELTLNNATLEEGILCSRSLITGPVDFFEGLTTGGNSEFTGTTFEAEAHFDEVDFNNDVSFEETTFESEATFEGTQFYGHANSLGDNTTFDGAVFKERASFFHATLKYTSFKDVTFQGEANFEKVTADGAVLFTDAEFRMFADFDEVTFGEDVSFAGVHFANEAHFTGVEFKGGAAILHDDVTFEDAVFDGDVTFRKGRFRYSNFVNVTFAGEVVFERSTFNDDCTFENAAFPGVADFDEVQFNGDVNFTNAVFEQDAIFRGTEFHGGTNYMEDDAIFTGATFVGDADFRDTLFTSANFMDTAFQGDANFTKAEFTESLNLKASSFGDDTYFNFTKSIITDGRIIQPKDGWVRFDLTEAVMGDVTLSAVKKTDERELLDYFRFCDTTFDDFDFSSHTAYLDRNNWNIHAFDSGSADPDYAVLMSPEVIEKTYLKAKNNASAQSNIKAAGEFRVKRQQHAREKFVDITTDGSESVMIRFQNMLRAAENLFLGLSCGYGLRLYRVSVVFLLFPLLSGGVFAFGGKHFETGAGQLTSLAALGTVEGLHTLAINVYFSYITFLTIGYGNIGPIGLGARALAAVLVYMNVILAGLFLYSLIKRSEI